MVRRVASFLGLRKVRKECEHVRSLSSDYIDNELDESEALRVTAHLGRCRLCRVFVRTLKATVELLRSTPRSQAPPSFRERILERVRKTDD